MNCHGFEPAATAELYLDGELSEQEQERWELHYFECENCFAAVEALRAIRAGLAEAGPGPQRQMRPQWLWPALAIAAALAIGIFFLKPVAPRAVATVPVLRPARTVKIARVEPPGYVATTARGGAEQSASDFRAAMKPYSAGDYRAAAAALGSVVEKHPRSIEARYFLSIALLYAESEQDVAGGLRRVAEAGDASPYAEEARFYLGYAYARSGKVEEARRELRSVIGQHGDYETRARTLLSQLD